MKPWRAWSGSEDDRLSSSWKDCDGERRTISE
jgi:hypothetical protein